MPKFAQRMTDMEGSAIVIRKLFQAMGDPNTISFGGGAPAHEGLPIEQVREIAADVLSRDKRGVEALQYGGPMGILELRQVVVDYLLKPKGVDAKAEDIMITTGGLETMNLLCQLYIDPGDVILVESPTFVHCVEIFEMFQARCIAVDGDDEGMLVDDLEQKIQTYHPKIVYVIPTFQNPSGKTLKRERRQKIAELGSQYDVLILEDDPYRDLRYSGEDMPPIKSFDQTGHTVYANSFSKIFSPGSRLGYVFASPEIMLHLYDAKVATNSHTSNIPQVLCAEFFKRGYFDEHLKKSCDLYRNRRDVMVACLEKEMPAGTKWITPDGGLFIWVELPERIDTTKLLEAAAEYQVAYIAGEGFFVEGNGKGKNCMRISFGNLTTEKIEIGMERLGKLIRAEMK